MNDEFKLQVTPKEGDSGLSLSKVRSGLIARGRKDAEMLAALAEAESELAPESEIKRLHDLYDLHVSDDGRSLEVLRHDAKRGRREVAVPYRRKPRSTPRSTSRANEMAS